MPDAVLHACTRCGEPKPAGEFNLRQRENVMQRHTWCRSCQSAYVREWRERTGRQRVRRDEFCQTCGVDLPTYTRGQPRKFCSVECRMRFRSFSRLGIAGRAYAEMLESQGGRCAICGGTDPGGSKNVHFAIDHCHETGTVRGLLCAPCNQALGLFKDNPERLRAAAEYLERSTTWHAECLTAS